MTAMTLIEQLESAESGSNELDVLAEVALFTPNKIYSACRANAAGTKVIYTDHVGNEVTCWAVEWSHPDRRSITLAALRARSQGGE